MRIRYVPNDTLRVKIGNSCNLRCNFCHNEGSHNASIMTILQMEKILAFATAHRFRRVHLTGGEPTLYRNLPEFIRMIKLQNLSCGLTSNGQCKKGVIDQLRAAGLDSLNISLTAIDPAPWALFQQGEPIIIAERQIESALNIIQHACHSGINVKLNIAVGDDPRPPIEIINCYASTEVAIRLLNVLGNELALRNIASILAHYEATHVEEIRTRGSSQTTQIYDSRVGRLAVKEIRYHRIPALCHGCEETCHEGVYAIRIEAVQNQLFARFCVHRQDPIAVQPLETLHEREPFQAIYQQSGNQELIQIEG